MIYTPPNARLCPFKEDSILFARPLVVDLDGTLILTDVLHESALQLLRAKPAQVFLIPFWLSVGKARLKQKLASDAIFNPENLPYNHELIAWLQLQSIEGRKLVLCTASDRLIASQIAAHLGIFEEVIASDGADNVSGRKKAELLEQRFGASGFDYIGNSKKDIPVWESSCRGVVANASDQIIKEAEKVCDVEHVFPRRSAGWLAWLETLRVHQWLKNLLLFVPLLAAHQIANLNAWAVLLCAFFSFSLCASSSYVCNDLLDLESDRHHPRKKNRKFASGSIPVWQGVLTAPVLLITGLAAGSVVGQEFLFWVVCYFLLTCTYSIAIKRLMLVDCLTLAALYTLRIIAGVVAIGQEASFWLLGFSVFLFLSLAFVKRYTELALQLLNGKAELHGRGYLTADLPLIQMMGITSGYASVVVLALYLNSTAVTRLYQLPEVVWATVPLMLFWVSWMWMQAHRGTMHDDPLVFALKDKASLLTGFLFCIVLLVGVVGLPWLQ